MKVYIIVFCLLFVQFLALSQNCLVNYTVQETEQIKPEAAQLRSITYLPVVVHILYNEDAQNISDEQIKSQLEVLNKDFNKTNENFSSTPNIFQELATDTEIQFCLASIDPQGNTSSGITRNFTNVSEIGNTNFYYLDNLGGKTAWDNDRYINIWVADMGSTDVLGFATMSGDGSPDEQTGLLIHYQFFGNNGEHMIEPHHLGKACTHEMGHFLGLNHIWGTLNTNCDDDDGCEDTPLQNKPTFGCPDFPYQDICTQDIGIMFMNFMDYTDDICQTMFTSDQKEKMWQVLMNERKGLLDNALSGCIVNTASYELNPSWSLQPNPTSDFLIILDESPNGKSVFTLYNGQGVPVFETYINQKQSNIMLPELSQGLFYASYKGKTRKLIIVK